MGFSLSLYAHTHKGCHLLLGLYGRLLLLTVEEQVSDRLEMETIDNGRQKMDESERFWSQK
jgi:hypothetical protein